MSLVLADVTIRLHARVLVDALSAEVGPGEVLAVMGESGSGKSTLLAWIAGLLEPPFTASGRVIVDGVDVTTWPVERRRIGLLFQDDLLFPHMSARDNLLFALPGSQPRWPPAAVSAARAERIARAETALERAGLGGLGARRPATLSGGQRARLSLLRARLAEPRALLLDEPFSRLDASLRLRIRDFVWSELHASAVGAVLVTHDRQDIPPAARVVELRSNPTAEPPDA